MQLTKEGIQMTNEEFMQAILDRLLSLDNRLSNLEHKFTSFDQRLSVVENKLVSIDRRLTSVEGKLNVIEVKVDNIAKICQADEYDARLKERLGLKPVPEA